MKLCTTSLHPRRSHVDSGMKKNLYSDIRSSWTSSWSNRAEKEITKSCIYHSVKLNDYRIKCMKYNYFLVL